MISFPFYQTSGWKVQIIKNPHVMRVLLVENTGVEPVTSCMPCKRSSQLS